MEKIGPEICKIELSLNGRLYVLKKFALSAKVRRVVVEDFGYTEDQFYTNERDVIKKIQFRTNKVSEKEKVECSSFVEILKANKKKKLIVTTRSSFPQSTQFVTTSYEGVVVEVFSGNCLMIDGKTEKPFVFKLSNVHKVSSMTGELTYEVHRDDKNSEKVVVIDYETKKDTFCYIYQIQNSQSDMTWSPSYKFVVDTEKKAGDFKLQILLRNNDRNEYKGINELICNDRTDFKVVKQGKRMLFKKKKKKDEKKIVAVAPLHKDTSCSYSLGSLDLEKSTKQLCTIFDTPVTYLEVYKCVLYSSTHPLDVNQIIRIKNTTKHPWVKGTINVFNPAQNQKENKTLSKVVPPGDHADVIIERASAIKVYYSPTTKKTDEMKKRGQKYFSKSIVKGRLQIVNLQGKPVTLFLSTSVIGKFIGSKEKCEVKETFNENDSDVNTVKTNLDWIFVINEGNQKRFTFKYTKWEQLDRSLNGLISNNFDKRKKLKKVAYKKPQMQQMQKKRAFPNKKMNKSDLFNDENEEEQNCEEEEGEEEDYSESDEDNELGCFDDFDED